VTRADRMLLAVAAALVMVLYGVLWQPGPGREAHILSAAGKPLQLDLDQARTVTIPGRLGPSVVEIDHGRARFVASPCTGKLCIRAGWQQRAGAVAACLPNGVSLSIGGGDRRFDAINF